MGFRKLTAFGFLVLLVAILFPAPAMAGATTNRAKCESWLESHYRSFSRVSVVREYTQDSEYHFRANYKVQPQYGDSTSIGFDCTVYLASGKVVAVADLETYKNEEKITSSLDSLAKRRMSSGGDACAELSSWKAFSDEMHKGNYSAQLPATCSWLEKGQVVLGPVQTAEYKGGGFALVVLPSGKQGWIEDTHL